MPHDTAAATDRLMRLLAVEGVTGQEAAIGREIAAALKEVGVPASAITAVKAVVVIVVILLYSDQLQLVVRRAAQRTPTSKKGVST